MATHQFLPDDHLLQPLGVDLTAAALSALAVSPTVTIVDRVVVEKASSNQSILRALQAHLASALRHPGRFIFSKSFFAVWLLYTGTYSTANVADTLTAHLEWPTQAGSTVKFLSTLSVNIPLGLYKDAIFAQAFGGASPHTVRPPPIPKATYGLFLLRDAITICGSFVLPPLLSPRVPECVLSRPENRALFAQLSVPTAILLVSTPLHLLGLDLYNRPHVGASDRLARVRRDCVSTTVTRTFRILPSFGLGVVANAQLRECLPRWGLGRS